MTENLAGRGEGLAGLVAKWREDGKEIKRIYAHPQDYSDIRQEARGEAIGECATELETALEAAAPAGPAPQQRLARQILDLVDLYVVGADGNYHAPSNYMAPEQWTALVIGLEEAALATPSLQAPVHLFDCKCLDCLTGLSAKEPVSRVQQSPVCPVKGISCDAPCKDYPQCVPAATQEQPAGSGVGMARSEVVGSPRKVGEDGARMLASEHLRPQNMRFRIAKAMAPVLPDEELRLEAANLAALSVNAALLEAARSSSVPVGEQK